MYNPKQIQGTINGGLSALVNGSGCVVLIWVYQTAWSAISGDSQVMKEIERARSLDPRCTSAPDFIREYAWVVFNSGMRMRAIRERWAGLERSFQGWDCQAISSNKSDVEAEALGVFGNRKKVVAVIHTACRVNEEGWGGVRDRILDGVLWGDSGNIYPSEGFFAYVRALSWMGPTNSRYLAKNLGFDLAKDDRHLRRLAERYDYTPDGDGVQRFVETVSRCVGERVSVVETVLWNACEKGAL